MQRTIKAFVHKGDTHYVAECMNIAVVTQGKTLDETIANLQQAVALFLEDENPEEFGLGANPPLVVTLELEPASHVAQAPPSVHAVYPVIMSMSPPVQNRQSEMDLPPL